MLNYKVLESFWDKNFEEKIRKKKWDEGLLHTALERRKIEDWREYGSFNGHARMKEKN